EDHRSLGRGDASVLKPSLRAALWELPWRTRLQEPSRAELQAGACHRKVDSRLLTAGFFFSPHPICPNCGKVSMSQKERFWNPPVRNRTPVATKSAPTAFSIRPNCPRSCREARMNG